MTRTLLKISILNDKCALAVLVWALLALSWGCRGGAERAEVNPLGIVEAEVGGDYDLPEIQTSGILIAGTISGPDTYFDYRGRPMGLQYNLVEHFALSKGVEVRMEIAHDTTTLLQMLKEKKIDLIALELPDETIEGNELVRSGAADSVRGWALRPDAPALAEALADWYSDSVRALVARASVPSGGSEGFVRRKARAPFLSQAKGVISPYDAYFVEASRTVGWDWRLIAAICYQESAFDPEAVSWAGARGLMQIMPRTAESLGLARTDIHDPKANIDAAARYLRMLHGRFSDVPSGAERIRFAIASYNGGYMHIRDAMALAQKHGRNSQRWDDVAPFVLGLSRPEYYNDPVVKYGYMIGSETHNYVYSIMDRWRQYGGHAPAAPHVSALPADGDKGRVAKKNRFTRETKILTPEEMLGTDKAEE